MNTVVVNNQPVSDDEYLQLTSTLMKIFVLVFNKQTSNIKYNTIQLQAVLGQSSHQAEGYDIPSLLHPDDVAGFYNMLDVLKTSTAVMPFPCRFMHADGTYRSFNMIIMPMQGVEVVMSCISTESLVAKSDGDNNLNTAIDRLQQSNRELEDFAYVASHDLQEPLRKISTFGGRLQEKYSSLLDGEGQMYLNRMLTSSANMRMFIDNLLEFSRIDRIEHTFAPTDLGFVLKQVMNDLELKIEETRTEIKIKKLPTVEAVSSQMKQLFNNIIGNAIKFRKPDVDPAIEIWAEELTDEQRATYALPAGNVYHKVSICDNGIGIESGYESRVFEIFQRLHGKSEYPGSGIGLAICKKIVNYHGGLLFANNNDGNGACIVAILPVKHNA